MVSLKLPLQTTRKLLFGFFCVPLLPFAALAGHAVTDSKTGAVLGLAAVVVLAIIVQLVLRRIHLVIDREGVERIGVLRTERIAWSDIARFYYNATDADQANKLYFEQKKQVAELPSTKKSLTGFSAIVVKRKQVTKRVTGVLEIVFRRMAIETGGVGFANGSTALAELRPVAPGAGFTELTLVSKAGKAVTLRNGYQRWVRALELIFSELHKRLDVAASTAPFAIRNGVLIHSQKGELPLRDIDGIVFDGTYVKVRKFNKTFAWVSEPMKNVENFTLFIEQATAAGVLVAVSPQVYLPKSTSEAVKRSVDAHWDRIIS